MNRIRKALKPIRKFVHKYVNGTKGMISIFLALVMSPLLSVSLLLVESARYQSTWWKRLWTAQDFRALRNMMNIWTAGLEPWQFRRKKILIQHFRII